MDPTTDEPSNRISFEDAEGRIQGWDYYCAYQSYRLWLGERFADPTLPPEASPNRVTMDDVHGFPPTWFPTVPELDPGRDAVYHFAQLLHQAGIFCDLHEWGGTSHILTLARDTRLGRRIWECIAASFADAVSYDFRRPWLDGGGEGR